MRTFTVNKNDGGQRLDKFITKVVRGLPPSLMYKYLRKKRIKLNGKKADGKQMLTDGDIIEMYIPDEFFSEKTESAEYTRATAVLDIVYEDENILLVNKKPGVLVHTGDEGDRNKTPESERETLIFGITSYLVSKGEYSPDSENSFAPALCNRIDRNTGGIVIAAKNAATLRAVNDAIKSRNIHKYYLCAVHGTPSPSSAVLKGYLRKDSKTNTVTVKNNPYPGAKEIKTGYRVLATDKADGLSLLEITLFTGRTHQIRAHMASVGHPLLGDGKYGINGEDRKKGYKYQALYSYAVEFDSDNEDIKYLKGKRFEVNQASVFFLEKFKR